MRISITEESKRVFETYARDAENWNGTPLVGGNVGGSKEERGNLTQLKRAGLITTFTDGSDKWIDFTKEGRLYAYSLGIRVSGFSYNTVENRDRADEEEVQVKLDKALANLGEKPSDGIPLRA